jgi:hypothetical protein
MRTERPWIAPLTGIAFILVVFLGFIVGGEPPTAKDSSPDEIVSWYVDNDSSVAFGAALAGIAATLFVFFGATLRRFFDEVEGGRGIASLAIFGGTLLFAGGIAFDGTISFALADAADEIDPISVQALQALWDNDFLPIAVGLQLFFLGIAFAILRHGALPRWIGYVALLIGIIAITPIGFAGFLAGAVLVVVISGILTSRARAGSRAVPGSVD